VNLEQDAIANAESWIAWIEKHAGAAADPRRLGGHTPASAAQPWERAIFGLLAQASAENPEGFAAAFAPIFGPERLNPLVGDSVDALWNVIGNGIADDWEIFLQWRNEGYVVVPEGLRREQDARFRKSQAFRLLGILTGGSRPAPGDADEAALLQDRFESEPHALHGSRPRRVPRGPR
jgi:hypothetical protein